MPKPNISAVCSSRPARSNREIDQPEKKALRVKPLPLFQKDGSLLEAHQRVAEAVHGFRPQG